MEGEGLYAPPTVGACMGPWHRAAATFQTVVHARGVGGGRKAPTPSRPGTDLVLVWHPGLRAPCCHPTEVGRVCWGMRTCTEASPECVRMAGRHPDMHAPQSIRMAPARGSGRRGCLIFGPCAPRIATPPKQTLGCHVAGSYPGLRTGAMPPSTMSQVCGVPGGPAGSDDGGSGEQSDWPNGGPVSWLVCCHDTCKHSPPSNTAYTRHTGGGRLAWRSRNGGPRACYLWRSEARMWPCNPTLNNVKGQVITHPPHDKATWRAGGARGRVGT